MQNHIEEIRKIDSYSAPFRILLAQSYCESIRKNNITLLPREQTAYTNVLSRNGFTSAEVYLLKLAAERK